MREFINVISLGTDLIAQFLSSIFPVNVGIAIFIIDVSLMRFQACIL